jgi:hypothetical protein
MGKMKEQCVTILEMIDNGVPIEVVADRFGMPEGEVTKIMELMGFYDKNVVSDDEPF